MANPLMFLAGQKGRLNIHAYREIPGFLPAAAASQVSKLLAPIPFTSYMSFCMCLVCRFFCMFYYLYMVIQYLWSILAKEQHTVWVPLFFSSWVAKQREQEKGRIYVYSFTRKRQECFFYRTLIGGSIVMNLQVDRRKKEGKIYSHSFGLQQNENDDDDCSSMVVILLIDSSQYFPKKNNGLLPMKKNFFTEQKDNDDDSAVDAHREREDSIRFTMVQKERSVA